MGDFVADENIRPIGYFTAAEVARLAGVSSRRVGRWARDGIILPSVSQRPNVYSYADAGEAVLARYLVEQGMTTGEIRSAVIGLRAEYGPWPLATAPLHHDGSLALVERPDGMYAIVTGGKQKVIPRTLVDLQRIRTALSQGGWVAYGHPRQYVEVDPDRHSGEPVVRGRRIATSRVAALAALPGGREELREDFGLSDAEIDDAVGYERDLSSAVAA